MTKKTGLNRPLRLAISQRFLTAYREDFFYEVSQVEDLEVMVFFGDRDAQKHAKFASTKKELRFAHRRLKTVSAVFPGFGYLNQLFFSPGILSAVRRFRPDVILTEGTSNIANNLLICPYAWWTRTPYLWWDLGKIRGQHRENPTRRFLYPLIRFCYRRAAGIFAYSGYARDFFVEQGIPPQKIVVSGNTVRVERFFPHLDAHREGGRRIRKALGFEDKLVFLAVGGMDGGKGFDLLIGAFEELARENDHIALMMVGDGDERPLLEDLADGHPRIHFAGAQYEKVGDYFAAGNVMVMPGLGGLAVNEAMAFGLPVIAGPADGTELDLVIPGKTGFLTGLGDLEGLKHHMRWCMENPEKAAFLGQNAQDLIREKYTLAHMVGRLREAITLAAPGQFSG